MALACLLFAKTKVGPNTCRYSTDRQLGISKRHSAIVSLILSVAVLILSSCGSKTTASIVVGSTKSEVLDKFGEPREWFVVSPRGTAVVTLFTLDSLRQPIPSGEIWLFSHGNGSSARCVMLDNDKVTSVEAAACGKKAESPIIRRGYSTANSRVIF